LIASGVAKTIAILVDIHEGTVHVHKP